MKTRTKFVCALRCDVHRCPETGTKFPKAVNTHSQLSQVWVVVVVDVVRGAGHATPNIREGMRRRKEKTRHEAGSTTVQSRNPPHPGKKDTDQKERSTCFKVHHADGRGSERDGRKQHVERECVWRSLGALKKCIEVSWSGLNQRG